MTRGTPGQNLAPIITKLTENNWVFDQIVPDFRDQLIAGLTLKGANTNALSRAPLLALAASFYHYNTPEIGGALPIAILQTALNLQVTPAPNDNATLTQFWQFACSQAKESLKMESPSLEDLSRIEQAIVRVQAFAPKTAFALKTYITHICCFRADGLRSFSHPRFFGCIFLDPSHTVEGLSVSLVHELAHQELFVLNLINRLVNQSADYNLVHAPFQGKPRPPIARLHAAHALYRMIQFHEATGSTLFSQHQGKLFETIGSFADHELSEFSKTLIYDVHLHACKKNDSINFWNKPNKRTLHG